MSRSPRAAPAALGSVDDFRALRDVAFAGAVERSSRSAAELERIERLARAGLVEVDDLIVATPFGGEQLASWYDEERARLGSRRGQLLHERFAPLDREVKRIATAWQDAESRDDWSERMAAIEALETLHEDTLRLLADHSGDLPRLEEYADRLGAAYELVTAGETSYVVAADRDSYHTIWFQLHEDLLRILDRARDSD